MAPTIPTTEPATVTAGDSITWRVSLSDFHASEGWALSYTITSATAAYGFTAAPDGDAYLVSIDPATSALWSSGRYTLVGAVTNGSARHSVRRASLQVFSLHDGSTAADTRSHARKMLDAIEAWLESRDPGVAAYTIHGRQMQYIDIGDLLRLRDRYRAEVAAEERAASGKVFNKLQVRF